MVGRRLIEGTALLAGLSLSAAVLLAVAPGAGGILPDLGSLAGPVANSLLVTVWALLLEGLVAFPAAVWMGLHPRRRRAFDLLLDGLASQPSVVAGLFGLALFVRDLGLGFSLLAGGLTVGVLNLPFAVRSVEAVLQGEGDILEAGLALGAEPAEAFLRLVLPVVGRRLWAPAFQLAARSMGETAALYLTSGVTARGVSLDPLASGPTVSLTLFYLLIQGAQGLQGLTSAVAFLMIGMGFLLHLAARALGRKEANGWRTRRSRSRA